jgi:hypothetical protein
MPISVIFPPFPGLKVLEPVEHKQWPALNGKLLEESWALQPPKLAKDVPVTSRQYNEKPPTSISVATVQNSSERTIIRELALKLIEKHTLLNESDLLQLVEFFKYPYGRKEFSITLLEKANNVTDISSVTDSYL